MKVMKKLTRKTLDEMAGTMPRISEIVQRSFIGGGTGTKEDPFTEQEFNSILASGSWLGGYVKDWGYVGMETTVTPSGSYTPKGGEFVTAGDLLYESNVDNKSGFWGDVIEFATGIVRGTDALLDVSNTFGGDSKIAEYLHANPNAQLYRVQKKFSGNAGINVYQDSYYDENGQLIGVVTHR